MNTNLGLIPTDIFCDYCSEQTGQEWTIEMITTIILTRHHYVSYDILERCLHNKGNGQNYYDTPCGISHGYGSHNNAQGKGTTILDYIGIGYEYGINNAKGYGPNLNEY